MTSDMQNIAEAFIGDHARVGPLVLEDGVGRGRGRMEDEVNLVGLALRRREETLDTLHDAVRGILRRGRNLVDGHRAGIEVGENEVGKRAADIDANHLHGLRTPSGTDSHVRQPTHSNAASVIGAAPPGPSLIRDESQVDNDNTAIGPILTSPCKRLAVSSGAMQVCTMRRLLIKREAVPSRHGVCFVHDVAGASPLRSPAIKRLLQGRLEMANR